MKKINHLSLMALVILLFTAVSCQKEDVGLPTSANEVTFNLAVENQVATRATPAVMPTRYIMELYSVASDDIETLVAREEQATASFTLALKEDTEYNALFYADYADNIADNTEAGNQYNAGNLKAITVLTQPTKVCFAASKQFVYDSEATTKPYLTPTLKHAVSQVNFVQGAENFLEDNNSLSVTIPQTFSYNATDGTVTEIASTTTALTFTGIAKENSGKIIGTSYIFANKAAQTVMDGVEIQFNDEPTKILDNVPFQANYKTNIKGFYNNLYNSTLTITSEDNWGEDIDKVSYAIGDLYPNATSPIGVVYEISNGGINGKIVSLDESATTIKWSEEKEYITNCDSDDNGLANMRAVWTHDGNSYTNYPAFAWVDDKNTTASIDTKNYADNTTGVWYLPAKDELVAIYEKEEELNNILETDLNKMTWTSTEIDADFAWRVFSNSAFKETKTQSSFAKVRAILAF